MITIRLGERHMNPDDARELALAIADNPGCCDEVWFSMPYSYPTYKEHEENAKKIVQAAEIFRKIGLKISLQISTTIGHFRPGTNCAGIKIDGSHIDYLTGPDGFSTEWCFCPGNKFFGEYIGKSTAIYAEKIKPDTVWIDDDFRYDCHGKIRYSCFCDSCINKFNILYKTDFTRENLVYEINYGDTQWRDRYIRFMRDRMAGFVEIVTEEIMKVSPDSFMGIQYAHWCNYMGADDNHIPNAMLRASGKPPKARPGGSYYSDKIPQGQFVKTMRLSSTNSLLPDYVKSREAEIENLPNIVFGKSIGGTIKESTLHMTTGCTALTYAICMLDNEPIEYHKKMLKRFSQLRPYWEKLSEISQNAYNSGLNIYHPEAPHMKKLKDNDEPFSWIDFVYESDIKLMTIGIPVTHEQRMPRAYLLHYDMVEHLNDNDIERLLSMPVITDAEVVRKLKERGYADRFRLKIHNKPSGNAYEKFTSHNVNGSNAGTKFTESMYFGHPMPKHYIEVLDNDTEVIGDMYSVPGNNFIGHASVITDTYTPSGEKNAKWAVFGYCVWNDAVSSAKRNQILNTLDTIAPLPAKLISSEQCAVIPTVNKEGMTTSVTIASSSIGETGILELVIRNPQSKSISIMGTASNEITALKTEFRNGEIHLTLPTLMPYDLITVFC